MIGAVGIDNQGLTGLEAGEDELLHGTDGEREVSATRSASDLGATPYEAEHRRRHPAHDRPGIQAETERVLAGDRRERTPKGATAIVMDPRNAQVLAMAN